jgi:ubiquinone/menaquinone biosynthesis C-methylase UbiE
MSAAFIHSTPELYDRYMGPLLFAAYAEEVARRARPWMPVHVLETAAGTGIVTAALHEALPDADIIATDLNPAMLAVAGQRIRSDKVRFEQADAQDLHFANASFDLVVSQFGVMFFPDKVSANAEARRVLRPKGHYVLVTFDALDRNPIPKAAGEAVASLFSENPRYMERGPFSYADRAVIERDVRAGGFTDIELETVSLSSRVNASDAAKGIVLGSPFRAEIERLGPSAVDRALDEVTQALEPWDGKDAPMSAHIVVATK